ncbi:MAG: hypothetical protein MAG715_00546 [Methanonatronarchaeales archaeon]|nr:hypothetical protein [Methanonatronarchaeales archaeon]
MGDLGAVIVDTDVLIDFLRGRGEGVDLLEEHRADNAVETTDVNVFELYHGAYGSREREANLVRLKGFLNRVTSHSTSEDSMELAGRIAADLDDRGEPVGVRDVLIGSIALIENRPVLTRSREHFERVERLELLG